MKDYLAKTARGTSITNLEAYAKDFKASGFKKLSTFNKSIGVSNRAVRTAISRQGTPELITLLNEGPRPYMWRCKGGYHIIDIHAFVKDFLSSDKSLPQFCVSIGMGKNTKQIKNHKDITPEELDTILKVSAEREYIASSIAQLASWQKQEHREKRISGMRRVNATTSANKKRSVSAKKRWADPDLYQRGVASMNTPEVRTSRSARVKHMLTTHTGLFSDDALRNRCKSLGGSGSKPQNDLANELRAYGLHVLTDQRTLLDDTDMAGKEIDIYLPDYKIAIEVNGEAFHYTPYGENYTYNIAKGKPKDYHLNKTLCAQQNGIHLLHFWVNTEIEQKHDQVLNKILSLTGKLERQRVFARKTIVRKVDAMEVKEFLDTYHIQGYTSSIYYALYSKDGVLLACMGFKKHAKNTKDGKYNAYDLTRYCTHPDYFVVGGYEKLEKAMVRDLNPDYITSIADSRVSTGNLYEHQGFYKVADIPVDYMYLHGRYLCHKFNFRKQRFKDDPKLQYEEGLTEAQLAELNGIPRCYDCGKIKYRKDFKPKH